MRSNFYQIRVFSILATAALIFIISCRKNNNQESIETNTDSKAISAMMAKIKAEGPGITTIIPINDTIPLQFITRDSKSVETDMLSKKSTLATYDCNYPGLINPYAILENITRKFECGYGYKYTVTYTISTPFNIVASNPYIPSLITQGAFRLKRTNTTDNSAGSVVVYENNLPVTISFLGDDPTNSAHFLFRCTFTSNYVTHADLTDGPYIEPLPVFASDCDRYPGVSTGAPTRYLVYSSSINPNTQPCTRTDKCFVNPSMSGVSGSIAGADLFFVCSSAGVVVSQYHDFQYREITGFTAGNWANTGTPGAWDTVRVASSTGATTTIGTLGSYDVAILPSADFVATHVYEFRYRNRLVSGTGSPCVGAWSPSERYLFY